MTESDGYDRTWRGNLFTRLCISNRLPKKMYDIGVGAKQFTVHSSDTNMGQISYDIRSHEWEWCEGRRGNNTYDRYDLITSYSHSTPANAYICASVQSSNHPIILTMSYHNEPACGSHPFYLTVLPTWLLLQAHSPGLGALQIEYSPQMATSSTQAMI